MSEEWSSDFSFSDTKNLGSRINGSGYETAIGISKDGLSFYFLIYPTELWVSTRDSKNDPWDAAQYLGAFTLNEFPTAASSFGFLATCTTSDGLECYLGTEFPGGHGGGDIWVMKREKLGDVWGPLKNLGRPVNTPYDEFHACVSPSGLELYFSGILGEGARPGGYGSSDLWFTTRTTRDVQWAEPNNLGPMINSPYSDKYPSISPDGLLLFFTSNRPGGYGSVDLYMVRRSSIKDPWGEPMNLGPFINTPAIEECARISVDGSTLYWDSDRPGGYGYNDMWQATVIGLGNILDPSNRITSIKQLDRNADLGKEVIP
jgi:hypothetical protein